MSREDSYIHRIYVFKKYQEIWIYPGFNPSWLEPSYCTKALSYTNLPFKWDVTWRHQYGSAQSFYPYTNAETSIIYNSVRLFYLQPASCISLLSISNMRFFRARLYGSPCLWGHTSDVSTTLSWISYNNWKKENRIYARMIVKVAESNY